MSEKSTSWEDRDLSPRHPIRFNYRRVVGGTRLLLTQCEPWNLLRQRRVREYKAALVASVEEWPGVEAGPHRFGGTEFLLDGREVGHIHNFGLLDVPLMGPIGEAVVAAGEAGNHHVLPDGGWVATFVDDADDVEHAESLLRLSYCWHRAKYDGDAVDRSREDVLDEVFSLSVDDSVAEAFAATLDART